MAAEVEEKRGRQSERDTPTRLRGGCGIHQNETLLRRPDMQRTCEAAEHSELSHDGTTNINREAELRRPTVIGSGDWFGALARLRTRVEGNRRSRPERELRLSSVREMRMPRRNDVGDPRSVLARNMNAPNSRTERQPPSMTTELPTTCGAAVRSSDLLAVIGEDGWMSPAEPPDTDRLVQLAWDDMSYGENSRGFYDSVAEMPASGKMFWWSWPVGGGMHRLPSDHIGAWREMTANAGTEPRRAENKGHQK